MAENVVLTAGTFLGGLIHIGLQNYSGGRAGDPPSIALAKRLRELPFARRPPEDRHTAAHRWPFGGFLKVMTEQPGDTPIPVMSFLGNAEPEHPRKISAAG